jgi:hypothetical protein
MEAGKINYQGERGKKRGRLAAIAATVLFFDSASYFFCKPVIFILPGAP